MTITGLIKAAYVYTSKEACRWATRSARWNRAVFMNEASRESAPHGARVQSDQVPQDLMSMIAQILHKRVSSKRSSSSCCIDPLPGDFTIRESSYPGSW